MPSVQLKHPGFITRVRNLERMREISAVAVKHGFGYLLERHRLFGLLPRWHKRNKPPPAQFGTHVREMLEELGPTFVKFGQLLSTRSDIMPADIVQELIKLQDRVPAFDFSMVEQVVEEDLGLRLDRAFESFETQPLASASIGQVHAAVLPGGKKVVVKVQRPEAPRQIRRDVDLLMQFAELVEGRWEVGFSPIGVVEEFSRSITRELDYLLEARNAMRFAANFESDENVRVPEVVWRYCSKRVLTLEHLEGPTLNHPEIADLPIQKKKALAEAIAACWFKQILHDGFIHADPHPANLVYLGEGQIGLLDFGMVGILRADDLEEGTKLFLRVMQSDIPGIKRSLRRLGMQWPPSADDEVTVAIEEAFNRYFGLSLDTVDMGPLLRHLFEVVYSLRLTLPSRFLILDKAVLTLEGVVSQLYPEINLFQFANQYTSELKRGLLDPRKVPTRVQRYAAEYAQIVSEYPLQLHDLLEELRSGELEVRYRHTGLENVIHRLDVIANRMVAALVSIALGVTGTAVAIMVEQGPHFAGLSVWGLPGFAGSLFFGVWLIYAIIRSGRL
ncbi:MAG: AarF/ABC1/UbiB kinase family protein [Thermoleophilia bacterium]|nr:AarF/ABC1/UbiB kinase family protein [Thermoleophilia bacterium]